MVKSKPDTSLVNQLRIGSVVHEDMRTELKCMRLTTNMIWYVQYLGHSKKICNLYNKKSPSLSTFSLSMFSDMMSLGELQISFPSLKIHLMTSYPETLRVKS
jgi:hypothetical protein